MGMTRLRQDLIVSVRRLRKSPGFTMAAILTLALGIGANTAVFTAINAIVFRPLPVDHPDRLVFLNLKSFQTEVPTESYPNYLDYRDRNRVLSGLAAYRIAPVSLSIGGGNNARIWSYLVTGNYFDVLGVGAARGRTLRAEDDRTRGGHPVAVLGYACWQRRFNGDPEIAGKRIKLNGLDYTVVGVAPRGFGGTEIIFTPDIFVPMAMVPQIEPGDAWLDERSSHNIFVVGRLRDGVTVPQAEAALNVIARDLGRDYPKDDDGVKIALSPPGLFGSYLRGPIRGFAAVLMGVAGLVLLIACVNLAGLLLARAADRRKETAIRLALGARVADLVRQLLTESTLLSLAGGVAGLLLAFWLTALFSLWRPPIDVPVFPTLTVDARVMAFALAVSLATGLLFGLAPALQSAGTGLAGAMKNEAVGPRLRRFHARDVLVGAQVALSVVLLVGSVLVVRSLQHAMSLNLGFDPAHASQACMDLGIQGYNEARGLEFQRRLLERVRSMPGIQSAGIIDGMPLSLNSSNDAIFIEGKPAPKVADAPMAGAFHVTIGYFHAARTRLLAGRDFDDRDRKKAPPAAIINQTFARQLLKGEDPLGKRFRFDATEGSWITIVGVVEDGKYRSLGEKPMPVFFRPFEQSYSSSTVIVARSPLPEDHVVGMLRRAVLELDPTIPIYGAGSVTSQLGLALYPARVAASVLGAFGLLAVVLAATSVYGMVAYAVSRRTREIGLRMALGASRLEVALTVLRRTGWLLASGGAAGLALAVAAGRLFSPILYGVSAGDPGTYAAAMGLMALVAVAACWFPSRRAMAVDPVTALRTE